MGLSIRLGSVAATNARATAMGEPVTANTSVASATWWTRSPNRLMSWPVHRAVNDELRTSRTYGCRRARSMIGGTAGRGRTSGSVEARPLAVDAQGPECGRRQTRPRPGQDEWTLEARGLGEPGREASLRPNAARSAPTEDGWRSRPRQPAHRSRPRRPRAVRRVARTSVANRKKPRPAVRKMSPIEATFETNRQGDRDDVAERARVEQERGVELAGSSVWNDVERDPSAEAGGVRLGGQIGMRPPLATIATALRQDPDEGHGDARVAAVRPQRDEQQAIRAPPRSGRRRVSASADPVVEQELGRRSGRRRRGTASRPSAAGWWPRCSMRPPAARPATRPSAMPPSQHASVYGVDLHAHRAAGQSRRLRSSSLGGPEAD